MPQLIKGGKNTYGWSEVSEEGCIIIPPDAFLEYRFTEGEKAFLIPGSQRSGGFGLTSHRLLQDSPISQIFLSHPELYAFKILEGKAVTIRSRTYCWVTIRNQSVQIPLVTLIKYGVGKGDRLLTVRGSGLSLGFVIKGPIVEEARKHPELHVYSL